MRWKKTKNLFQSADEKQIIIIMWAKSKVSDTAMSKNKIFSVTPPPPQAEANSSFFCDWLKFIRGRVKLICRLLFRYFAYPLWEVGSFLLIPPTVEVQNLKSPPPPPPPHAEANSSLIG